MPKSHSSHNVKKMVSSEKKALAKLVKTLNTTPSRIITSGVLSIYREHTTHNIVEKPPEDMMVISLSLPKSKKTKLIQAKISLADFSKAISGLSGNCKVEAIKR